MRWRSAISCSEPPGERVSRIAASFAGDGAATGLVRLAEAGQLRLRRLRGAACEALVVNTAGAIVGGDRLALELSLSGEGAALTAGTAAAEKCYRVVGAPSRVDTRLVVGNGARLDWLPQETILFDGARLARSLVVDIAGSGRFVGAETIVFGRLAHGETMREGALRDSWRVWRDGDLMFADDTRLEAPIDTTLDRPAVGGGARATAMLVAVVPAAAALLDPLRQVLEADSAVEAGVSLRDGILVARILSRAPERLRARLAAAVRLVRGTVPRSWE